MRQPKPAVGVDPGLSGAIALIQATGELQVWEMPPAKDHGIDLILLKNIISEIPSNAEVYLEWNRGRPTDVPDRALGFGIQLGQLQTAFEFSDYSPTLVYPLKWMNGMGVPGKDFDNGLLQRQRVVLNHFPDSRPLWTGPRGGLKDGVLEAILIAKFAYINTNSPFGKMGGPRPPKFRATPPEMMGDTLDAG